MLLLQPFSWKPRKTEKLQAVQSFTSIFEAARDLRAAVTSRALRGSGLTDLDADLLVTLIGAERSSLAVDTEGWVLSADLERRLVYEKSMLSRRLTALRSRGWIDVDRVDPSKLPEEWRSLHGNSKRIKITDEGRSAVRPVWEAYCNMADMLLEKVPQEVLQAHYALNDYILQLCEELKPQAR